MPNYGAWGCSPCRWVQYLALVDCLNSAARWHRVCGFGEIGSSEDGVRLKGVAISRYLAQACR
eukprot:4006237-Pyramimonas_sp.AAC.2